MTTLGRITVGLLATLNLSGVPNGTDLHGLQNWQAYRNGGSGAGLFRVESGEIESHDNVAFAMALWGDGTVANPGHCIRADVMSTNWNTLGLGLNANGALDHSEDTRGFLANTWELTERSGTGDYGEGFLISNGTTPGQPLTNSQYYPLLVASVQNPGVGFHARGGICFNNVALAFNDTTTGISTGINDGSSTYPGVYYYQSAGARWRNYKVYRDYRITVQGLSGSQAFRLYDSLGGVLASSGTQSGGAAHVNVHTMTWPITGYLQVFTDTTYAVALPSGRYPTLHGLATDLNGGDVFDQVTLTGYSVGIQINWDDSRDSGPDAEWASPTTKNVEGDLVELDLSVVAADPKIEVDTCQLTLKDPTGKYVPANTTGSLYPNVRLAREGRVIFTVNGVSACRFYGTVAEYHPLLMDRSTNPPMQQCQIRLESPLRALASAQVQLGGAPSGVLVNSDGVTGVIPSILSLLPDLFPAITWALDPTPTVADPGFLSATMTVQTALEQCAILSDSVYSILPHLKLSTAEPNYYFKWQARDVALGASADHDWLDSAGDIGRGDFRYTGDLL